MKIKTNIKDVIWNYISIFFSLASQIIWLPALLYFLPSDPRRDCARRRSALRRQPRPRVGDGQRVL